MSDAYWQLDVAPTARETYEAMILAGQASIRGAKRALLLLFGVFVGLFAPLGATMVLWIFVQMAGGPPMGDLPVAAVPLTLLAFGALGIWLMRRLYFVVAQASVASRFGRWQQVNIGPDGITLRTAHSEWHSGWGDVVAIRGGKTCLCITISAIAITLPLRAFANPPDATHALQMMQTWQGEAA